MKDRSATVRLTGPPMCIRCQRADVGPIVHVHPRIGLQRPHQLAVADVDRLDLERTAPQQDVGEPAGRGTGIQAAPAGRRRGRTSPARRCSLWAPREAQFGSSTSATTRIGVSCSTPVAGLVAVVPRTWTRPAAISSTGLLPRSGQLAADQFGVQPKPSNHGGQARSSSVSAPCRPACKRGQLLGQLRQRDRIVVLRAAQLGHGSFDLLDQLHRGRRRSRSRAQATGRRRRSTRRRSTGSPDQFERSQHAVRFPVGAAQLVPRSSPARPRWPAPAGCPGRPPPARSTRASPSLRTSASRQRTDQPVDRHLGMGLEQRRDVPAQVGRPVLGRRGQQTGRRGHAGQHEQRRAADPAGALDVGVQPVADHDRRARRRIARRSRRACSGPACRSRPA